MEHILLHNHARLFRGFWRTRLITAISAILDGCDNHEYQSRSIIDGERLQMSLCWTTTGWLNCVDYMTIRLQTLIERGVCIKSESIGQPFWNRMVDRRLPGHHCGRCECCPYSKTSNDVRLPSWQTSVSVIIRIINIKRVRCEIRRRAQGSSELGKSELSGFLGWNPH